MDESPPPRGRSLRSPSPRAFSRSPSPRAFSRSRSRSRSRTPPRARPMSRSRSRTPPRARPMSRSRTPPRARPVSRSRSPPKARSKEWSRSRSRSRSHGRTDVVNPGNTLYVTGLSTRVHEDDLYDHFSKEGKVRTCHLVKEPRTEISRGFAFVTMDSLEDAERCIKYLNQSVLEGRYITVEKSRRKGPRPATPGQYLGLKSTRDTGYRGDRGRYRGGGHGRDDYGYRRSPRRSPYRGSRDYSPRRSPYGDRSRRERSYSPYASPARSYGRR